MCILAISWYFSHLSFPSQCISKVIFIFACQEMIKIIPGSTLTNHRWFPHGSLRAEVELIYTIYQGFFPLICLHTFQCLSGRNTNWLMLNYKPQTDRKIQLLGWQQVHSVFPQDVTGKPKWAFWPSQYIIWTRRYWVPRYWLIAF